jgi:hypothetical protein
MTQNVEEGVKHSTTGKIKKSIQTKIKKSKQKRRYATIYKS